MGFTSYFKGKKGVIFWLNIILMAAVLIGVPYGSFQLLSSLTHHGEKIEVPNVCSMPMERAKQVLQEAGFEVIFSDSLDTKAVKPGCVLEQVPKSGTEIKSGRIVYLVTRYKYPALIEIPKLVGEHSYREAKIILTNLGFRFTPDSIVEGQDEGYLVGIYQGGKRLLTGDKVPKAKPLTLYVGGGIIEMDSVEYDTITKEVEIDDEYM